MNAAVASSTTLYRWERNWPSRRTKRRPPNKLDALPTYAKNDEYNPHSVVEV